MTVGQWVTVVITGLNLCVLLPTAWLRLAAASMRFCVDACQNITRVEKIVHKMNSSRLGRIINVQVLVWLLYPQITQITQITFGVGISDNVAAGLIRDLF
jgi:hypothetical protein